MSAVLAIIIAKYAQAIPLAPPVLSTIPTIIIPTVVSALSIAQPLPIAPPAISHLDALLALLDIT